MPTIEELFSKLNRARVKYILIGGMASIVHGAPRTTVDIDIAIEPTKANVDKVLRALGGLGLVPDTDKADDVIAQGGVTLTNSLSVDILTDLPGKMRFGDIWKRRLSISYRGTKVKVVSRNDQIKLLRSVGRPRDLEDANIIEESA